MFPTRHSLTLLLSSLSLARALTSSLTLVTGFGTNPTNVTMYIYVPTTVAANPPIVVDPHWCHGDAAAAFAGSQLPYLADTYGFIVIFPDSPNTADKCWDVSSNQTLTHNGGGDSLGIVSMVKYTLAKYNGNADRVFATGTSSGAMMTNVLLGSYPDVFAAGSAWAGVAFGCFAGNGYDVWSSDCATGLIIKTGAEWKAIVEAAYPGYSGFRPKMQVFHGTADTVLYPQNLQEEIKEWTAVLGLPSSPISTIADTPLAGWTKYVYGSKFEAYSAAGVTHDIQTQYDTVMAWFDLTCTTGSCYSRTNPGGSGSSTTLVTSTTKASSSTSKSSTTSSKPVTTSKATTTTKAATTTTTKAATTTTAAGGTVPKYGQCGGIGYTGPTTCAADAGTCHYSNDWYSQCY